MEGHRTEQPRVPMPVRILFQEGGSFLSRMGGPQSGDALNNSSPGFELATPMILPGINLVPNSNNTP